MIRKLLAFVVLLGLGFAILRLALGESAFRAAGTQQAPATETRQDPARGGVTVPGTGGEDKEGVRISIRGAFRMGRSEEVPLPQGSTAVLETVRVEATDSEPVSADRMRLNDVTVSFFERGGAPADPRAVHVATLRAVTMFVTLGKDAKGRPALDAEKEMDLRDVVLTTTEASRFRELTLRASRALVRVDAAGTWLRTPDDAETFELVQAGARPLRVTGRGVDAFLPAQHGAQGSEVRVTVRAEPTLFLGGPQGTIRARGTGPLEYRESRDGRGHVTMGGGVTLEDEGPGRGAITARGRDLVASLSRAGGTRLGAAGGAGGADAGWNAIRLDGAPATLIAQGTELHCGRLDLLPGPGREPWLFRAHGSPALVDARPGAPATRFRAHERIELVRPAALLAPLLSPLGFPERAFTPGFTEIVEFAGRTDVEQPELAVRAADGMRLFRHADQPEAVLLAGRGAVEARQGDLQVQGSDGILLVRSGAGERVRLGPAEPRREHRFTVTRGDVRVRGSGTCAVTRDAEGEGGLAIRSPEHDVTLEVPGTTLEAAGVLQASFAGEELRTFLAEGTPCRFTSQDEAGNRVTGTGDRLTGPSPDRLVVTGTPAVVERAREGALHAPRIEVARFGRGARLLHARGGARLRTTAAAGRDGLALDLDADTIEVLPWTVPGGLLELLHAPLPAGVRGSLFPSLRAPKLVATGDVRLRQAGAADVQGVVRGAVLVFDLDSRTGRMRGRPATIDYADAEGRKGFGSAAALRFAERPAGRELVLEPGPEHAPRLRIANLGAGPGGVPAGRGTLELLCETPIEVLPARITLASRVEVYALDPAGRFDPDGLRLGTDRLVVDRDPDTGAIRRLVARGAVRLRWAGVMGFAEELTLDPNTGWIEAKDVAGKAMVILPSGLRYEGRQAAVNYLTFESRSWSSEIRAPEPREPTDRGPDGPHARPEAERRR
ncbi:MAG: hypothetical protein IT458_09350 [Planctomycetes bacterium]|nr:hypothetical protein [Planctomycetota bacterium]